jgi:UDP-glucose 4-epimerase
MKTILVTGGAGYIGSQFAYDMLDRGFRVIIIDNLSTGHKKLIPKKAIFFKGDITNIIFLKKVFKEKKIEAVFHFAASVYVPESNKKPLKYFKNNVIGTKNLLDILIMHKIKYLIFSSTCAIYDSNKQKINEKNECFPESFYGLTKLQCENLIKIYAKKFKFRYAILRYFNVIGCDKKLRTGQLKSKSLFKSIISNFINKKNFVNIYGNNYKTIDGTCVRDYIDINDLSVLHYLALKYIKNKKSIIFNCGYQKPQSVLEIIKIFENILNIRFKKKYKNNRQGDIASIYANNCFLKKNFPKWKQKYSTENSIENIIKWEKKCIK